MKVIKTAVLFAAIAIIGIFAAANAGATLVISTNTPYVYHDPDSSNPSASDIAADLGITTSALGTLLFDTDGGDAGTLQGSYSSTSVNTYPVFLTYGSGTVAAATFLIVKDGNDGSYFFNLGSTGVDALNWNGMTTIEILDLFAPKGNGDLSHYEFYGGDAQPTTSAVPEPSTIISGLLLLVPLSIQVVRSLNRNRLQPIKAD